MYQRIPIDEFKFSNESIDSNNEICPPKGESKHTHQQKDVIQLTTALTEWQKTKADPCIPTFSQALDKLFGAGGIPLGSIIEISGPSGSGKTQLCLQLCAAVQIPRVLGGCDGQAIYIDTNSNFTAHRLEAILEESHKWLSKLMKMSSFNLQESMEKVHYVNAVGMDKLCATMHFISNFLNSQPRIKLVAIDNIDFPFKEGISKNLRTGYLFRIVAILQRIALRNGIVVILTNDMCTRIGLAGQQVVSCLGDAWAHRSTHRILLSHVPHLPSTHRVAALSKNGLSSPSPISFQITCGGISDI